MRIMTALAALLLAGVFAALLFFTGEMTLAFAGAKAYLALLFSKVSLWLVMPLGALGAFLTAAGKTLLQWFWRFMTRTIPMRAASRFIAALFWIYLLPAWRRPVKHKVRAFVEPLKIRAAAIHEKWQSLLSRRVKRHWARRAIRYLVSGALTILFLLLFGVFILFADFVMPVLRFLWGLLRHAVDPLLNKAGHRGVDYVTEEIDERVPIVRRVEIWRIGFYRRALRHSGSLRGQKSPLSGAMIRQPVSDNNL